MFDRVLKALRIGRNNKATQYDIVKNGNNVRVLKGWSDLQSRSTESNSITGAQGTVAPGVTITQSLYKYRSWIGICVDKIASKAAVVPYFLKREFGQPDDEIYEKVWDHPLLRVLKNPSNFMSGRELRANIFRHVELCGCAFGAIIRNQAGQPAGIHLMNPHELVNIERGGDTSNLIRKFVFAPGKMRMNRVELSWNDCLYFHKSHPADPLMPCSTIQLVAHQSDIDMYLQTYTKDFLQNNARPDFLIILKEDADPNEITRARQDWESKHKGPGRQGVPAFITGDVRVESVGMSAKDFEFLSMANWTKDMIFAAFGVPEAMTGLQAAMSKDGLIAAQQTFAEECLAPRLDIFADVINAQLVPQFNNLNGLTFCHDKATPRDEQWEMAQAQGELTMGITTLNEVRRKKGKPVYPSAICDVPWVNGTPVRGVNPKADKMQDDQMAATQGGVAMGSQPGMISSGQEQTQSGIESNPNAQGVMGNLGGRPEGTALMSIFQESLRQARPGLSALMSASRGNRGGLMTLFTNHPELSSYQSLLDRQKGDPVLSKLMTRGLRDYICKA
jgi:HK97 family phage portal protein